MSKHPVPQERRSSRYLFLFWPAAALVACIALWLTAIAAADAERERADALVLKQAAAYAQAYEQYITRSAGQMDQVTMQLKHSWEQSVNRSLLEDMRRDGMFTDGHFVSVSIIGREGTVLSSTQPVATAGFGEARFFTHHRDNISSALRMGPAPSELARGRQAVMFSRRLDTADDEFDGVVVLAIDTAYFTSFINATTLGPDELLAVAGAEGRLRVEQRGDASAPTLPSDSLLPPDSRIWSTMSGARLLQGAAGFADGRPRVLGWKRSQAYPLIALVALSHADALAGAQAYWRESRKNLILASVCLVLLSLLAAMLSLRAAARQREQDEARRAQQRKAHELQLERLANEDGLTGLPNRYSFFNHTPAALAQAADEGKALALLFIDLDEFKQVNDSHGHAVGDRLLKLAASRLVSLLRPSDRVARFGGDEFVVLLDPCQGERQVAAVAERIVAAFAAPFSTGDELVAVVGASIGISIFPRDGTDVATLVRNSDIAMYAGKNEGKGRYRFFDQALSDSLVRHTRLKHCLVEAIDKDQFILHYQPRVDARTGRLLSMEALLRWVHPELGTVPPSEFIPLAESSGLIVPLGALVIDKACAQVAAWSAQGAAVVPVSINVSPRQFARGSVKRQLCAALSRHKVAPTLLEVEITESAMMGDNEEIRGELAAIRALGVKLHVDDFGTGYSSLSQLQRLRMDVLKIDRSFTAELGKSREGQLFFQAIVSMAHALGMGVVAEGVETAQQLDILRQLGCNEVQGYYVSRPMPADAMAAMMARRFLFDDTVVPA